MTHPDSGERWSYGYADATHTESPNFAEVARCNCRRTPTLGHSLFCVEMALKGFGEPPNVHPEVRRGEPGALRSECYPRKAVAGILSVQVSQNGSVTPTMEEDLLNRIGIALNIMAGLIFVPEILRFVPFDKLQKGLGVGTRRLERVMNLGENRIEMRIPRSAWFPRDLRFPHS
jgi:hypothetical protein